MFQRFDHGQADSDSRTTIDLACGVLVGLRGYPAPDAFRELAAVVHSTGVGLGGLAAALVALAAGSSQSGQAHSAAVDAWGALIDQSRPRRLVRAAS